MTSRLPNSSGGLRNQRLLNFAIFKEPKWGVDLGFLGPEVVIALAGRVSASQRPWLPAFSKHCP